MDSPWRSQRLVRRWERRIWWKEGRRGEDRRLRKDVGGKENRERKWEGG